MKLMTHGATRWVLLVGNLAIKFPRPTHYRNFLQGILGNEQESKWSGLSDKLCPVLWISPLCLILVMPRARVMANCDVFPDNLIAEEWILDSEGVRLPVELKPDSFGYLPDGRLVAIDYGS